MSEQDDRADILRARDVLIDLRRLRLNADEKVLALGLLYAIEQEMPEAARQLTHEAEALIAARANAGRHATPVKHALRR